MASVFWNPRGRQWQSENIDAAIRYIISDIEKVLFGVVATLTPIVLMVKIGQMVQRWQQYTEIQKSDSRHCVFSRWVFFAVSNVFNIEFVISTPTLMKVGWNLNGWDIASGFRNQNGCGHIFKGCQNIFSTKICVLHSDLHISIDFDEDWSNSS